MIVLFILYLFKSLIKDISSKCVVFKVMFVTIVQQTYIYTNYCYYSSNSFIKCITCFLFEACGKKVY